MTDAAARLQHIAIRDFRNLADVALTLPPEGLVLVGDNGQGKTNFLEAVYYLQILRSARGARDADLVRFGADGFHLGATVVGCTRANEVGIGFERAGRRKRVRLDGAVVPRLSDALGALPSVMFSPADVEIVAGEPAARRRYLDIALALTSRSYLLALQRYRAALARRNSVLRDAARAGSAPQSFDLDVSVWEPALAEHGAVLVVERRRWIDSVAARFTALARAIGESGVASVRYATPLEGGDPATAIAAALERKRGLDMRRGTTHAGPHRDTLALTLDGHELRGFGSAGQQRTASIALRILEAETYRDRTGASPVFLMDDPFAELDARRSARIVDVLAEAGLGQTLLAVPRREDIPSQFTRLARACVAGGTIDTRGEP